MTAARSDRLWPCKVVKTVSAGGRQLFTQHSKTNIASDSSAYCVASVPNDYFIYSTLNNTFF